MKLAGLRSAPVALCVGLISAQLLLAQAPVGTEPAQVMVLGTYHFANPGLDVVKTEVADVLSATKQEEIHAVVEALARFRPTRIAVEQMPAAAPRLDSTYRAYRSGDHELTRNETEQIGFRLAAMLGHPRVFPIDHPGDFPFEPAMAYAQAHDSGFVALVEAELARLTAESKRRQEENTVAEILRAANAPEELAHGQSMYMRFAQVGAGDTYVGADLLSKWYERNIHIFANLQRITESGARVLLIIGSGHAPILRELISYDAGMLLVDPLDYLPSVPEAASTAEAELLALDSAWIDAEVHHDQDALERILDEGFLATFASGRTIDRAAFTDMIMKAEIEPFEVLHDVIRLHGDVALVIDSSSDRKSRYTWIAVRRGGGWRVISETFTRVATP